MRLQYKSYQALDTKIAAVNPSLANLNIDLGKSEEGNDYVLHSYVYLVLPLYQQIYAKCPQGDSRY